MKKFLKVKNRVKFSQLFSAFTLAEVLIVLGIIGVVAAMTIPVLMQRAGERETVTKLKKAYSTLSNAYNLAINNDGVPTDWGTWQDDNNGNQLLLEHFLPYLKVLKNCGITQSGCMGSSYKTLDGLYADNYDYKYMNDYFARAVLQD